MPNCFTLTRKSNPEAGPVKLTEIDEEMCRHFGQPCHEKEWLWYWYDIIGLYLACGKDWQWIREKGIVVDNPYDYIGHGLLLIVDYLEANYTTDAWAEVGGR